VAVHRVLKRVFEDVFRRGPRRCVVGMRSCSFSAARACRRDSPESSWLAREGLLWLRALAALVGGPHHSTVLGGEGGGERVKRALQRREGQREMGGMGPERERERERERKREREREREDTI
jgi:hypothetical protein